MRFLLSTFTSLSITGGALIPLISKNQTTGVVSTFAQERISLGETQELKVVDEEKSWSFNFASNLSSIKRLDFEGGGLRTYVEWGSDRIEYSWPAVLVKSDGYKHVLYSEERVDGLAYQKTEIWYTLGRIDNNSYHLQIDYHAEAYSSFSRAYGTLTIGNALIFSN